MPFIPVLLLALAVSPALAAPPVPALSYTGMKVQIVRVQLQQGGQF